MCIRDRFSADELPKVVSEHDQNIQASEDKPVLIGISAPYQGQRFVLDRGRISVGRRADNDVVLAESSVSSMHAWIIGEAGSWRVMNMLSTNGTFVNDEKVHEAELHDGDRLRIGSVELVFRTNEAGASGKGQRKGGFGLPLRGWLLLGLVFVALLALWLWFK